MAEVTLQDAVKNYAKMLAEKINTFADDISTLDVRTYTTPADQVEIFVKDGTDLKDIVTEGKATLRAFTAIAFDGDIINWVPTDAGGQVDKTVWNLHHEIVGLALTNRARLIESLGTAAASALNALAKANE